MLNDPLLMLRALTWDVNHLKLRYAVSRLIDYIEDDVIKHMEDEGTDLSNYDILEILTQGMVAMDVNLTDDEEEDSVDEEVASQPHRYTDEEIEQIVKGEMKKLYGDQEKED